MPNGRPISCDEFERVKATCLYVAVKLGAYIEDVVIVGGIVPYLLIDNPPPEIGLHAGTGDLDVGLSLGILEQERYRSISSALRDAGFRQAANPSGGLSQCHWEYADVEGNTIPMDFLIPPPDLSTSGGALQHLENDFGAIITPGLELAFINRVRKGLTGSTIDGARASRELWVCGPAAFIVLKALAFGGPSGRATTKDAYDLCYVVRFFGGGVGDIAQQLKPVLNNPNAASAIQILQRDFVDPNGLGCQYARKYNPESAIGNEVDNSHAVADLLRLINR